MKKQFHLLALLCTLAISVEGQYFFYNYGTTEYEEFFSGEVCDVNGPGHLLGGLTIDLNTSLNYPNLIRTDVDGSVPGGTTFMQQYEMWQNTTYTMRMKATESHALELPSGDYAMAGAMYKDNTYQKEAIWYTWVDANGVPDPQWVNIMGLSYNLAYYESSANHDYYHVDDFILASTGTEAYILGHQMDGVTAANEIFLIKVDVATGALIFHNSYIVAGSTTDGDYPYAMVENPGAGEVAIAGSYDATMDINALLLRVNNTTGAVIAAEGFGDKTDTDVFHGIILSQNTGNYIIIGSMDVIAGDFDTWLMEYDYINQVVVNTQRYDCALGALSNYQDTPYDIVERFSATYGWEYFITGTTLLPVNGFSEIFTYRIDPAFNVLNGATYGTSDLDWALDMDQDNAASTAAPDGLSLYGGTGDPGISFGSSDEVIHKAYFNWEYPCNFGSLSWNTNSGNGSVGPLSVSIPETFRRTYGWIETASTLSENPVCTASSMPLGDNSRLHSPAPLLNASALSDGQFHVSLSESEQGKVTVDLINLSGQVLATQAFEKASGAWEARFAFSTSSLPAGIYLVRATTAEGVVAQRVRVD